MKITIYELLRMIKDNKKLPKKIRYGDYVYVLQENPEDYATWLNDNLDLLNDVILGHFNIEDAIYLELEIIEEKKIPEKIKIDNEDRIQALSTGNFVYTVNQPTKNIIYKINEIIDTLEILNDKIK